MKKTAKRTAVCLILVGLLFLGMVFYLISYFADGGMWVSFPVNRHVYDANAEFTSGTVTDRGGEVLATMQNGYRVFNNDLDVRLAALHAVGDFEGNIGTGALYWYRTELMGYNPVSGAFSVSGAGSTLRLSIDSRLQTAAYEALAGRKGAVFFYNYKTGEVLSMVSAPSYDPYDPPDEAALLTDRYDGAYINRCLSSSFTPGSVFKTVTLAAAIDRCPDLFTMRWHCGGETVIDGEVITCSGHHGELDIREGFAQSCNVVFAELAQLLGGEVLQEYAGKMGLLDSFTVSGIPVAAGNFTAPEDGGSDLSWSAIGQYRDLVNPAAIARMMGGIANGGSAVTPRLVSGITTEYGLPAGFRYLFRGRERLLTPGTAETLAEMLGDNAENVYAGYYHFSEYPGLAAKSGTAEAEEGELPHAWFAGYLADEEHPVAFAVVLENAGWGLAEAGAVADRVLYEIMNG